MKKNDELSSVDLQRILLACCNIAVSVRTISSQRNTLSHSQGNALSRAQWNTILRSEWNAISRSRWNASITFSMEGVIVFSMECVIAFSIEYIVNRMCSRLVCAPAPQKFWLSHSVPFRIPFAFQLYVPY